MKSYWGEEMPDIDYNILKRVVIEFLAKKAVPLTGNEVRIHPSDIKNASAA